ncbi:DUF3667 domain-containing protein [uncultured Christiangramia sp.]|uniref:DUF3667 domain-containing protein n=1 Tax=uncultured Christiangramia sp. TaxID=503836 RepID=UPI0025E0413C|nr:DUF3667 domain-containing protein [uncultured Christiangramia sp.]|tara:strand:- start:2459 stop:3553 length:1095 start_codon:yes stop_codon:yes gene_type:complete
MPDIENRIETYQYRGQHCLNCELPLDKNDRFCPNCGQLNTTKKLSFSDLFNEFFSGVFAYDSRFQRTLRILLFRPGKISKDYVEGKRTRYANPFRFYLSVSIIFFLIFSLSLDPSENFGRQDRDEDLLSKLDRKELSEASMDSINKVLTSDDVGLDSIQNNVFTETYTEKLVSQPELDSMNFINAFAKKADLYYAYQDETGIFTASRALDSLNHEQSNYNLWLYKKAVDAGTFSKDPALFINYFIGKLPFIIFIFLPVFALFIWLLYLRRDFNYMEHLIFAFHVQTVFFVLYSFALILEIVFKWEILTTLANFVFLFYLYKAMRFFYGQKRVKTILKFLLLNLIFFTLATVAAIISLLASFSIY